MHTVTLTVKGMSCGHCVNAVEEALAGVGAKGNVDLGQGLVTVTYDDSKLSLNTIKEAIIEQGYEVESAG